MRAKNAPFTVERNFLGTAWNFVVRKDGSAYWVKTDSLKIVESSRGEDHERD